MSRNRIDLVGDADNPEWTEEDFAEARRPEEVLPADIVRQFKPRGPQKAATKELISIRLSRDVLVRLRADGAGWQGRIDDMLRRALGL